MRKLKLTLAIAVIRMLLNRLFVLALVALLRSQGVLTPELFQAALSIIEQCK